MILRPLSTAFLLALTATPAFVLAQTETSAREDERMSALSRGDQDGWYSPKNKFSVGVRVMSSGAQVDFGNLGTVPSLYTIVPGSEGEKTRSYTDGVVGADSLNANEKDANGNQTSTPGGRYQVTMPDANGNPVVVADNLSYTPGLTRRWEAEDGSQLDVPGYVAFNIYSATSDGGTARKKQGATGGVEFQVARDLGRGSRHFQLALMAGIALTDINGKSAGKVSSTLNTYTDYYSLNGLTLTENQLTNPSTTTIDGISVETTVPISSIPDPVLSGEADPEVGGAEVSGRWQVKGAYFLIKLGPTVRTQITDRLGLSASAGFAGGYAGTRYTASESFSVDSLPDVTIELTDSETGSNVIGSTTTKFVTGYFADVNLEWAASDVVGLFGGVTAQQLSSYEQKLGERTAKIDLGNSVGIRGGVSIRF